MNTPPLHLLVLGTWPQGSASSAWGPFDVQACATLDEVGSALAASEFDALVLQADAPSAEALPHWPALSQACAATAVLIVTEAPSAKLATTLIERGVQDVIDAEPLRLPLGQDSLARSIHLAVLRKRLDASARKAYATDLATGLPNQMQLLEHMNHLLALREREPAPMALLVIRVEGLATAEATLGAPAAGALRRKLAVRLRASLRASDVVASVGADAFAALLAWIDTPAAAERVGVKLMRALHRPLRVSGQELAVAVSVGVAQYPEQGKDAQTLLRHAFGAAASQPAQGRVGFANRAELGAGPAAANDEHA